MQIDPKAQPRMSPEEMREGDDTFATADAPKPSDPTYRLLTCHQVNNCNEAIEIRVLDGPGQGGACHEYECVVDERPVAPPCHYLIRFQNGPIAEVGTNGITHEALLAILIDRLEHFQRGPYACRENAIALTCIETAMAWLKRRTEARLARGVEGTHEV